MQPGKLSRIIETKLYYLSANLRVTDPWTRTIHGMLRSSNKVRLSSLLRPPNNYVG